ncbi:glucan biosynthesis protein [Tropicimonas sp. IMCC34011]|uniref:glucan biosynthesis protein n=1 Tax=Tropicimonas sp. IMCC34011 TaxID=2248759 RepID=UPI000E27D4B0|nr:glucan biosynthesis protein G [Tropicimonas sp. IMCC34011]
MISRRTALGVIAAGLAARGASAEIIPESSPRSAARLLPLSQPFSVEALRTRARAMAEGSFTPRDPVPQEWQDLSYDEYRSIWFRDAAALWNETGRPLRVDFFAPGLYFPRGVSMFVVEDAAARMVAFDMDLFDTTDRFPDLPVSESMGFSGLRLRAELEKAGIFQEFAVFQGASYFRAIGQGEVYGLSARALTVDTAGPKGEEFPDFTEFYLEAPDPGATSFRIHALLDSPSVTGVYSFDISAGETTVMDVDAVIYPRRRLANIGLAPLTSMFLFDQTNRARFDDFRSAVHDSEGLCIHNGRGETLWRPLANPRTLQISQFLDDGMRGFGLMQRTRGFSAYSDLEALYHKRTSAFIEPKGDWGPGSVTLVEIPADREIYDNIVTYWSPREPLEGGSEVAYAYRITWGPEAAPGPDAPARIVDTRIGRDFAGKLVVVLDFAGTDAIENISAEDIYLNASRGTLGTPRLETNPDTGGPRLTFSFDPGEETASELRAQFVRDGAPLSEVWLYRWTS